MIWIKVMDGEKLIAAEAHEKPQFVRRQSNGAIILCDEAFAQGIVSEDGTVIYQMDGKASLGIDGCYTAYQIYGTEYDALIREVPDIEDDAPELPPDAPEEKILTRAELTARVQELEAQNAMLTDCLLEISEVVYAGE